MRCEAARLPRGPRGLARVHPAPFRPTRTPFQRDRERIVQSRAFRRLAGKTQVFTSRASDHFRSDPVFSPNRSSSPRSS